MGYRKRDHKFTIYDLRDHFGLTQCVVENNKKIFLKFLKKSDQVSNKRYWQSYKKREGNRKFGTHYR